MAINNIDKKKDLNINAEFMHLFANDLANKNNISNNSNNSNNIIINISKEEVTTIKKLLNLVDKIIDNSKNLI